MTTLPPEEWVEPMIDECERDIENGIDLFGNNAPNRRAVARRAVERLIRAVRRLSGGAEITVLRAQLAEVTAERDAATSRIASMTAGMGRVGASLQAIADAEAERDTARAEVERMRAVVEAAKTRTVSGHGRSCAAKSFAPGPCDCGHEELKSALLTLTTSGGEG